MSRISLSDAEISKAAALISSERLTKLIAIAGNAQDAIDLHQQMLTVAGAMMPVTALLEIALRNAIYERLTTMFGTPDWLLNPPQPFKWRRGETDKIRRALRQGQRAVHAKISQADRQALDLITFPGGVPGRTTHDDRIEAQQNAITITVGQLIAQMSLFFWKRLFSSDYETVLWKRSLRKLFPDKGLQRSDIAARLEAIYRARNRIAHHELLYGQRLVNTLEAIDFIAAKFGDSAEMAIIATMIAPSRARLQLEADLLAAMIFKFSNTPVATDDR